MLRDEEALVRRARDGDTEAFRQLFEVYHGRTWRVARLQLALYDRMLTDDAVQEAWLDAWRGLDGFDPERPFLPWLLTVVRNRCRQMMRGKSGLSEGPGTERLDAVVVGREDGSFERVEATVDPALWGALAALPPEQREVVEAHYYVGLTLAEVAAVQGTPPGTVKKRLHLALTKLRGSLPPGGRAIAG